MEIFLLAALIGGLLGIAASGSSKKSTTQTSAPASPPQFDEADQLKAGEELKKRLN